MVTHISAQRRLIDAHRSSAGMLWLQRWIFGLVFLAALIGVMAQARAQPSKPLTPVSIALGTQVVNLTYPWLTLPIALGYWRDEGYDVKILRKVIRIRKQDKAKRQEEDAILDLYLSALGEI